MFDSTPTISLETLNRIFSTGACKGRYLVTTRMNRNTLKVRLRKPVAEQYLMLWGRGKATHYRLPELYLP